MTTDLLTYVPNVPVAAPLAGHTVSHPHLVDAWKEVMETIVYGGASVVIVVGPGGGGKSHLLYRIRVAIRHHFAPEVTSNPGTFYDLYTEVKCPEMGVYRWKDFYIRSLIAGGEPLIDRKLPGTGDEPREDGLRRSYENMLKNRKPKAHHVDEAHHWMIIANPSRRVRQMSCVKSIVNMSQVVHVLYGTHELLELGDPDEQLDRRVKFVPLLGYSRSDGEFEKIAANLIARFGDEADFDLSRDMEDLHAFSLGLPGRLVDWLSRGYARARINKKKLTMEIMRQTGVRQREDRLRSCLEESNKCLRFFNARFNGDALKRALQANADAEEAVGKPKARISNASGSDEIVLPRNKRPGARNPHRDAVGVTTERARMKLTNDMLK